MLYQLGNFLNYIAKDTGLSPLVVQCGDCPRVGFAELKQSDIVKLNCQPTDESCLSDEEQDVSLSEKLESLEISKNSMDKDIFCVMKDKRNRHVLTKTTPFFSKESRMRLFSERRYASLRDSTTSDDPELVLFHQQYLKCKNARRRTKSENTKTLKAMSGKISY